MVGVAKVACALFGAAAVFKALGCWRFCFVCFLVRRGGPGGENQHDSKLCYGVRLDGVWADDVNVY